MREFPKACNVYCHPEGDRAIVAAVYNHSGLFAEKPNETCVIDFSDGDALNRAIQTAIGNCEFVEDFNYSDLKRSDWPAFQASGYKTVKRFEGDFLQLSIYGANEKNLSYEVTSPEFGDFGLQLRIAIDANSDAFGVAVQFIVRKFIACKAATS